MARYLVYTSPARGHLYPIVPTLEELKRRGHEVVVRTLASEVELLRGLGFEAAAIDPAIERRGPDDWQARTPIGAQRRAVRMFADRAEYEVPDLQRAIESERPDALLIDVQTWGAAALAEASGLPWAYFLPYFAPIDSKDAPPIGSGFTPRDDRLGRLRDRIARRVMFVPWQRRFVAAVNEMRTRFGLRPLEDFADLFARTAPLVVYYSGEPFEYPRSDWPASFRLVGPGIWDPPADPPPWLENLRRPLVLVTMSTEFQNDRKLVETAFEALAGEDVNIVATTGAADPSGFTPPPNARVVRFLPHRPVLERANCVVCHGGMGITQKALAAGVPVCAVPFGRDQFEVARRVEVAGAGTRLPALRLRPDRLRQSVREAMGKKAGAESIAAAFAAAGGPHMAAGALEELLQNHVSDRAPRSKKPAQ
ncbi:glycosyltransferase [soil metagenome]|jgi:MGT family glycosyltransferase